MQRTTIRIQGIAAAALAVLGVLAGEAGRAAPAPKFPSPGGTATFKMSGMMNGTQKLYWTDSGKKFRQEVKATMSLGPGRGASGGAPARMPVDQWSFCDGRYYYSNAPGKVLSRMQIPPSGKGGPGAMSPLTLGQTFGKVVGKGTVLGRPCEIRQEGGMKLWVWQGLTLKYEIKLAQQAKTVPTTVIEATQIDTSARPAASLFQVPPGYQVKDAAVPGPDFRPRLPGGPSGSSGRAPGR